MEDLIKALQILLKYGNPKYPTHCEHDCLYIIGIEPEQISDEDKKALDELGFIVRIEGDIDESDEEEIEESEIFSYRYGSA
jgi:hypothetical protein